MPGISAQRELEQDEPDPCKRRSEPARKKFTQALGATVATQTGGDCNPARDVQEHQCNCASPIPLLDQRVKRGDCGERPYGPDEPLHYGAQGNMQVVRGLVSTIIPVYNRSAMLREAVASVVAQTYRPIEIIVVDDGSTDETPQTIRELGVRSVRIANGGPGAAREAGRQVAEGEFIQYLDSDDLLLPRKFELQVAALNARPEAGVAYGLTRYRDAQGNEIECTWKEPNQRQETILPSFLLARWWETSTPLYRRSITDAAGPWLPLRLEEDWEYDVRVGALGTQLAFVDEYVAEHRDHPHGRLSKGIALDPDRMRQRAIAHELIAESALRAVPREAPEMQHFARELFHIARQAGAAGLGDESRRLLRLARRIAPRWDLALYGLTARAIGWTRAGRLSMFRERF